jgi:ubiquinone/menaquinone biosynthesis C-methylase UbiE
LLLPVARCLFPCLTVNLNCVRLLMTYFARDFADVDRSEALDPFIQCLELQQSLPFYQYYKQKTFDFLQLFEGASLLEVGCGTGEDAIALARRVGPTGKVIAIDRGQGMIERAIARSEGLQLPLEFLRADARQLPFADHTFDGARIDRTLQHIDDPQGAIAEMARVVRVGGRVVAIEPDWETLTVNSQNRQVTRRLLNFWCDNFPSGWVGRNLGKYFYQAELGEIQYSPKTLIMTDFALADRVLDLVRTARGATDAGVVSPGEAEDWLEELGESDRTGAFFSSFTVFIVAGVK